MHRFVCASAAILIALPAVATAQMGISIGVGGGIAGSTDQSLSNGQAAPIVMGQATWAVAPLIGIGAEVEYWRRRVSNVAFATGVVQVHLPATPFSIRVGGGFGSGDPDGRGSTSGPAVQVGAAYEISLPAAPVGFAIFANAFLAHGSSRNVQMLDGGLSITWR